MDAAVLARRYEERYPLLRDLADALEQDVFGLLEGEKHIDRVYFRAKEPWSFLVKAGKDGGTAYEHPLAEIEDQIAGRVLVFFLEDVDPVVRSLRQNFVTVETARKTPQTHDAFGYESFHCVFTIPPHVKPRGWEGIADPPITFEMQVRTLFQHAWAEPQHDIGYKEEGAPREALRELAWAAASAWGADQGFQRALQVIRGGKG